MQTREEALQPRVGTVNTPVVLQGLVNKYVNENAGGVVGELNHIRTLQLDGAGLSREVGGGATRSDFEVADCTTRR